MLVRKLTHGAKWSRLLATDANISAMDIPGELFAEFVPSVKDDGWLSLYEIKEEDDCAQIAAALSFLMRPAQNSEQFFLAVSDGSLERAGLNIRMTSGQTFHSAVDSWHREVNIPSTSRAIDVVDIFLAGELFSAKGTIIENVRASAIRGGEFRVAEAAKNPKANENSCGHILVHVGNGSISPAGSPN